MHSGQRPIWVNEVAPLPRVLLAQQFLDREGLQTWVRNILLRICECEAEGVHGVVEVGGRVVRHGAKAFNLRHTLQSLEGDQALRRRRNLVDVNAFVVDLDRFRLHVCPVLHQVLLRQHPPLSLYLSRNRCRYLPLVEPSMPLLPEPPICRCQIWVGEHFACTRRSFAVHKQLRPPRARELVLALAPAVCGDGSDREASFRQRDGRLQHVGECHPGPELSHGVHPSGSCPGDSDGACVVGVAFDAVVECLSCLLQSQPGRRSAISEHCEHILLRIVPIQQKIVSADAC
mmetsp:Transcript_14528/g.30073  ORF Transcript_14528/g.30073 Transcript_14528/m.30073 type:complete len:288 (-) Transcript_14528:190-1053(-)